MNSIRKRSQINKSLAFFNLLESLALMFVKFVKASVVSVDGCFVIDEETSKVILTWSLIIPQTNQKGCHDTLHGSQNRGTDMVVGCFHVTLEHLHALTCRCAIWIWSQQANAV